MDRSAAFFSGPYDEAKVLLVEARDYIAYRVDIDQADLPAATRLQVSFETMRITVRLTQAMAWLLARRAVHAGEMSMETLASDAFSLGGQKVCDETDAHDDPMLPIRLRALLERSHSLYIRVGRLDAMVRQSVEVDGCAASGPPVVRAWGVKPVA